MTVHRHSAALDQACDLLETLSNQATRPPPNCPRGVNPGIIANLISQGWTHHSTQDEVHIFVLDDPLPLSQPHPHSHPNSAVDYFGHQSNSSSQSTHSLASGSGASARTGPRGSGKGKAVARGGLRSHEFITVRGEGWIEGDWREEDVAATVQSKGAREVWDPRFDGAASEVVQHLSRTDTLLKANIRSSFVSRRDACLAQTVRLDKESAVAWVAGTSVEDALVPRKGPRTNVRLNGLCLRSSSSPPQFDPPATQPDQTLNSSHAPIRPGHRRAKSSLSHALNAATFAGHPQAMIPPLPTYDPGLMKPALARKTSSSFLLGGGMSLLSPPVVPTPLGAPGEGLVGTLGRSTGKSLGARSGKRTGYHVSFIAQASPGQNLPQTAVDELTLHLPLSIASINRYLSSHGFAPHIIRQGPGSGLSIVEEFYCAATSTYRLAFRILPGYTEMETLVRFHGASFARGRFDISLQHLTEVEWRVEYDNQPSRPPAVVRRDSGNVSGLKKPGNAQRKSSLSVLGSPPPAAEQTLTPAPILPSSTLPSDPASACGPLGGCTIHIDNSSLVSQPPIVLTITPNSEASRPPLDRMKRVSEKLAEASRVASREGGPGTIEELLEGEEGELRGKRRLAVAAGVLDLMRSAREELSPPQSKVVTTHRRVENSASPVGASSSDFVLTRSPESARTGSPEMEQGRFAGRRGGSAASTLGLGLEGITED